MATSDQILDAATRQSAGEELTGADRTMANMVNNAANPELPQEIKEGWAQMSLEDRSMALGSLIDEKKGGTTAPAQTAPESNTGPSVTLPVERTKEERDTYASTGWETGLEADPNDEWLVPEMPTIDLGYSDKTKNQKLSMAAIIKAGETGRPLAEILYEMNTDGSKDRSQETLQDAGSSYQISEQEVAKDIANRQLMGEMQDPEEMADTVEATNRYVQARIEDQAATYKSYIMSMGIEEDAEDVIETLQGNAALYNVVMEAADEVGLGDQVWDIGRSFVLGSLKDNMMLSGLSGVVGSEDYLMSLKAKLDNTDPKDREAVFRVMNEELKEILPDVQRLRVLQTLVGTTPEQDAADNFGPLDPLMDAGEVALYATGVGLGAYGTYKGVKALKKLGSSADDVADTIALGVAAREKAAKSAIGMDDEAVNSTLDPFRGEWVDQDALDDLSFETRQRLLAFREDVTNVTEGLRTDERFLREGWLTREEEAVARRNIEHQIGSAEGVDNVVTRREGDKIIAEFDVKGDDGIRRETQEIELKLDEDTQEIVLADPGMVKRHLTAKGVWATEDFREIVRTAERLDLAEAKVLDDFRSMWVQALEPLTGKGFKGFVKTFTPKQRKKIKQLDNILISGDEYVDELGNVGKVYTPKELRSGILGFVPDEDVMEAYYNARNVIDGLWYTRNAEMRKELVLKGNKNWNLSGGEEKFIVKALSDPNAVRNSFNANKPTFLFDDTPDESGQMLRELVEAGSIDVDELYAQGKVIVKLDKPAALSDYADEVRYAITDADNVTELPMEVLNYRAGYVPKINENVGHIVKLAKERTIDGSTYKVGSRQATDGATAVRFFDSKKEADIWVDEQNRLLAEKGVDLKSEAYLRVADRQLEKERSVVAMSSEGGSPFSGGLYTGSRSSQEILYGAEGTKPARVNAYESVSRAMTANSKYIARNEWRLGLEQRILKSANQLFAGEHSPLDEPFTRFDQLRAVKTDTEAGRKVRAMYDAAADWLGFPTAEELLFKESIQGVIDNAGILTKLPGARKGLHSLKSKDPVGAARSAAFHGLLGFWNPVQMWVQAQGAAVAASMNIFKPGQLARVMRDQQFIHTMQYVARDSKNFKHWAKAFGKSEDEARELIELWDKTGLQQSVLTTADHSAAEAGYGVTLGALRGAADKGLFFYRGGELFNRRLSFMTAYHDWKAANKDVPIDDSALKDILTKSNNLMLNMGKAQRATWQRGILGVATQFQQINMRIMETLLGANGNFTKAERGKMMLGQFALYGAAGVPLSSMGMQWAMEQFGYTDQAALENEIGAETVKLMNEGFLGWATLEVLGVDLVVGERSSLLGGIRRTANDFMFTEGTLAEKMFGAFGNTSGRFWSAFLGTYKPLSFGLAEGRGIDPVLTLSAPLLSSISSFRNADKAIFMHNMHRIMGSGGKPMIEDDFKFMAELGVGIGFQLTREADIWKVDARNRAQREYEKTMADTIYKMYIEYALKDTAGQVTPEYKKEFENRLAVYVQNIDPNGWGQKRVMESVQKKLQDRSTKEFEVWEEYMNLSNGRHAHEFMLDMDKLKKAPGSFWQGLLGGGDTLIRHQFMNEGEEE